MEWLQCKGLKWTRDASTLSMHNESLGCIRKSEHDDIGARRQVVDGLLKDEEDTGASMMLGRLLER